jgi:hypothetical protein
MALPLSEALAAYILALVVVLGPITLAIIYWSRK